MAYKLGNRVKMTVSGTPGTGTITLGSAVSGFNTFGSALSDGDTCPYVIEDTSNAWEIGVGTYTASGTTLARTTVVASSAGGTTKINATSAAQVYLAPLATDLNAVTFSGILKANGTGTFSAATAGTDYLAPGTTATITVGFGVTPYSIGTVSSGTTTLSAANGNYQFYTNNGAHTLAAPSSDCAIDVLITNGASAGSITFSGFTVGSSTGSALTTTNSSKFIVSVRRINSVSTYSIYALQ